jgi:DNA (cytosine-5)-methyltransferase 1
MKHGSLFSGIGGFDLAAEWMNWENVFHCEWNEFGKQVLKFYWPNTISYEDITKTDFTIHRGQIDILTGGFPCQPYSAAGKRKGKEDKRHLWPEMLRAIREIQPTWIVGENVYGLFNWSEGLVFEEVCADLEAEGYKVQPCIIPAAGVNAPHRRDRVWFVAYNANTRTESVRQERKNTIHELETIADTGHTELQRWNKPSENNKRCITKGGKSGSFIAPCIFNGPTPNANSDRLQRGNGKGKDGWGQKNIRIKTPDFTKTWQEFPTEPPVCGRNDGISSELVGITFPKHRKESLKGYGNAVVPQVVYQIFKAIEEYMKTIIAQEIELF